MFNFRKVKEKAHDWAYDVEANNERMLAIINIVLKPISEVTITWKNDYSFIESNKKLRLFTANLYQFENFSSFLKYFNTEEYYKKISYYISQGYELEVAKKQTAKYYINISRLKIENPNKFEEFYDLLKKLECLLIINKNIKIDLIKNNYITIFENCRLINLIRRKNGIYSSIIGSYEDTDLILGENGIKIKNGDNQAISYIVSLEELENFLENKKTLIELDGERRNILRK